MASYVALGATIIGVANNKGCDYMWSPKEWRWASTALVHDDEGLILSYCRFRKVNEYLVITHTLN
jgi:hypothetical protein